MTCVPTAHQAQVGAVQLRVNLAVIILSDFDGLAGRVGEGDLPPGTVRTATRPALELLVGVQRHHQQPVDFGRFERLVGLKRPVGGDQHGAQFLPPGAGASRTR